MSSTAVNAINASGNAQIHVGSNYGSHPEDRCLADLRDTDPRHERRRIEQMKGGLLRDAYRWILDSPEFQQWHHDEQSRMLWVKGDPGKGKTMLIIGIIEELSQQVVRSVPSTGHVVLSYFLCQSTDLRLNNAISILRGLIYLLIDQCPFLIFHLRKKYDHAGKVLFEDRGAFFSLSEVLQSMLQDPKLTAAYLIVDGLDECKTGLTEFLELITRTASEQSTCIKWIVSSRKRYDIEQRLIPNDADTRLSLELNAKHVSDAINEYIHHKVSEILPLQRYPALQERVRHQLQQKAEGTFLWVALVIEGLRDFLPGDMLNALEKIPRDLTSLYDQMMCQIQQPQNQYSQRCLLTLSIAVLAYRPLHLCEMQVLSGEAQHEVTSLEDLKGVIIMCGSFLTIRENYIYFIHQTAKDHLTENESAVIFPSGSGKIHREIFLQSLNALKNNLGQNIYDLQDSGIMAKDLKPNPDPLVHIRYSCVSWFDHLCEVERQKPDDSSELSDHGTVFDFFNKHFLHWLESLSLMREVSKGLSIIRSLLKKVQVSEKTLTTKAFDTEPRQLATSPEFARFLKDAERFVLGYRSIIEQAPLQTYGAALAFCPTDSEVRKHHWKHRLPFLSSIIGIRKSWDLCLQTLEGHSNLVQAVAFSPNGHILASGSVDHAVRLWEAANGVLRRTLKGHTGEVRAVDFSSDGRTLASASSDHTIRLWDSPTGACKQTLRGHGGWVQAVAFSPDGCILASASGDKTVRLWNATSGAWKQTLQGHGGWVQDVAFTPDGRMLASASSDKTVRLWDATTWKLRQILKGHHDEVLTVAFSLDNRTLASGSGDRTVRLWDTTTWTQKQTIEGHEGWVRAVAFSLDGRTLASASGDRTVRLWDTITWNQKQALEGHSGCVQTVAFSPDRYNILASASDDYTIRLWDTTITAWKQTPKQHSRLVRAVAFSPDNHTVASASDDHTVCLWDVSAGTWRQTLKGDSHEVQVLAFSPDGRMLASGSDDSSVRLWNIATNTCKTLEGHQHWVHSVAFSPDSQTLATASGDHTIRLWEVATRTCSLTVEGHFKSLSFSGNGQQLITDRGLLSLDSRTLSSYKQEHEEKSDCGLFVSGQWVMRNGKNLLWLPPDYRAECWTFSNNRLVLGHASGRLTFLELC